MYWLAAPFVDAMIGKVSMPWTAAREKVPYYQVPDREIDRRADLSGRPTNRHSGKAGGKEGLMRLAKKQTDASMREFSKCA